MMKRTPSLGWFVILAALLWYALPKPSYETAWESLQAHAYFVGHLWGLLPAARPPTTFSSANIQRGTPGARPSNGSVPEVQGFVDMETFKAKYLYKGPVVFRNGATKEHGFNLECLTGTGKPFREEIARQMGERKVRIFTDSYEDGSATHMTIKDFQDLAKEAEKNTSMPVPYARAIAQNSLGECRPLPEEKIVQYHGMFSSAQMLPVGTKALMFLSFNKGTTTKMHFDVGDSILTQVVGRKKWLFVEPEYATTMKTYGEAMNLFYSTGYDVHLEAAPPEVFIKETILYPGDVLYFPSFTFHAVANLDDTTLIVDQPCMDFGGSLMRHWLCAVSSLLNPFMILKVAKQFLATGTINGHEVYFDDDYFSKTGKEEAKKLTTP